MFHFLYEGPSASKLFSHPKTYQENPILNQLVNNSLITSKQKTEKTCDEVFYEYLCILKPKQIKNTFLF